MNLFHFDLSDGTAASNVQVKGNELHHYCLICYLGEGVANLFLFKDDNFWYMWHIDEKRTVIFPYLHFVLLLISLA